MATRPGTSCVGLIASAVSPSLSSSSKSSVGSTALPTKKKTLAVLRRRRAPYPRRRARRRCGTPPWGQAARTRTFWSCVKPASPRRGAATARRSLEGPDALDGFQVGAVVVSRSRRRSKYSASGFAGYARRRRDSPALTPFCSQLPGRARAPRALGEQTPLDALEDGRVGASGSVSATVLGLTDDANPRTRTPTPAIAAATGTAGASRGGRARPEGMSPFVSNAFLISSAVAPVRSAGSRQLPFRFPEATGPAATKNLPASRRARRPRATTRSAGGRPRRRGRTRRPRPTRRNARGARGAEPGPR